MRRLVVGLVLGLAGCVYTSGPNCQEACNKAVACPGLDKTYYLNCSPLSQSCVFEAGLCAECILRSTCEDMAAGLCDVPCGSQQNPVLLPLEEARPVSDPRLELPAP
jgi:hypothetical protein